MGEKKKLEWLEAQKIKVSVDLVTAATQLVQFLGAIDRKRDLYEGFSLDHAIYRYKKCWLPLLAKQSEVEIKEGPLVVPLDCEWVWYCHRLNPTQYKMDCEKLHGRILDNFNVVSTIHGTCTNQTTEIWRRMYPDEPFELDLSISFPNSDSNGLAIAQKSTDYDLVSAVRRQSTFYYQVSRPFMTDDVYLKEAIARYKGFLHLIKKNKKSFYVPTYDIDLIWHAHQMNPVFYCKDTKAICGHVLEHDDTDSDRTEGNKLDVGFMMTTEKWEETYGLSYWRAGALYSGNPPSPLTVDAHPLEDAPKNAIFSNEGQNIIQLPKKMLTEVLLEIIGIRDVPEGHGEDLFIFVTGKHRNLHNTTRKKLKLSPQSGKKQVAEFQCEPTGELFFELISGSSSTHTETSKKIVGSTSVSLSDLVNPGRELYTDRWFELYPPSETMEAKPIFVRISLSFTPPFSAPYVLYMVPSDALLGSHTSVLDEGGNQVIGVYMRRLGKGEKEVIGILESGKTRILANNTGKGWSLMDSQWDFHPQNKSNKQGNLYELKGQRKVIIMSGKKLDYETKHRSQEDEQDFITAVEFSPQDPYGKAVALSNLRSGILEIKEDWFLLPGILSAYILHDILMGDRDFGFAFGSEWEMKEGLTRGQYDILLRHNSNNHREVTKDGSCIIYDGHYDVNTVKSGACTGGGGGCGGGCGGGRCGGSCGGGGGCGGSCGGGGGGSGSCGGGHHQ